MSNIRRITAHELRDIIKSSGKPLTDYAVVDVRDDDFVGGNILNALHVPSESFDAELPALVLKLKETPKVVFHCTMSKQRGPNAAAKFENALLNELRAEGQTQSEILVLSDGFAGFQAEFKDDPELVEKWQREIWGKDE